MLSMGRSPSVDAGRQPRHLAAVIERDASAGMITNVGPERRSAAVVLLSGGLDSATALAVARRDGFDCYALSFRYGQRHAVELEAATRVAAQIGVAEHAIADIDLRLFGG